MTEKRYKLESDGFLIETIIDTFEDIEMSSEGVVSDLNELYEENEQLKQQKPFLKIHNDYFIQYGDDGQLFSMHKPSDIRSLCRIINRENGYSELQCEYNDIDIKGDVE